LLFELDALHRGLLRLTLDGTRIPRCSPRIVPNSALSPARARAWRSSASISSKASGTSGSASTTSCSCSSLLLPAVLVHENGGWRGVARFRDALVEVLWVVTAFTVAHSITLSLAALGLIQLPSRWSSAAAVAALRAEVDEPVGGLDHVEVVLDDDDGVAVVAQALQHREQHLDVVEVQAGGRLVEDVERAPGVALGQLQRQLDALRLAAGQRGGALAERM
jgi:hypothetical protein